MSVGYHTNFILQDVLCCFASKRRQDRDELFLPVLGKRGNGDSLRACGRGPCHDGRQVQRIAAALEVTNDLIDHYAALAVYQRLTDLLPPTAQPKK